MPHLSQPIIAPRTRAAIAVRPAGSGRGARIFYAYLAASVFLLTVACISPPVAIFLAALPMMFVYIAAFCIPFLGIPLAFALVPFSMLYAAMLVFSPFFLVLAGPIWIARHMNCAARERARARVVHLRAGGCMRDLVAIEREERIDAWHRAAVPATACVMVALHLLGFHFWH